MPINTAINSAIGGEILNKHDKIKKQDLENLSQKKKIFLKNSSEDIQKSSPKTDLALQKLVNKLLDEIKSSAQKNHQNLNLTNNATSLKIAPNLAKDLKNLSANIDKFVKTDPKFMEFSTKIKEFLKPIESINSQPLNTQIKNSGIMFEANIKQALNPEILPKSITNLISAMKRVSSNELFKEFVELGANENLSTKDSFESLKNILNQTKEKSSQLIQNAQNQPLKQISTNGAKLENIAKFISTITSKISQVESKNVEFKALNEPNLVQNSENLNTTIPNVPNLKNTHQLKTENLAIFSQNTDEKAKFDVKNEGNLQNNKTKIPQNSSEISANNLEKNLPKEAQIQPNLIKDIDLKTQINFEKNIKNDDFTPLKENLQVKNSAKNFTQNSDNSSEISNQKPINLSEIGNIDVKKIVKKINQTIQNISLNLQEIKPQKNIKTENSTRINTEIKKIENILKDIENSTQILENFAQASQKQALNENFKTIITKDLNSSNLTLQEKLNVAASRLDQLCKITNLNFFDAKTSLKESKILSKTLQNAYGDMAQISPQNAEISMQNLKDDIKKTLLDISQNTKNSPNPNINQINSATNRLIAQIDIHQLVSFATGALQTYIPYLWNGMDGGNIAFKQGSKNRYYCKIDLNFQKFGALNILLALKENKFIEITILAQNDDFKELILKHSKELKSQIFALGLNITNFSLKNMSKNAKFGAYETFSTIDIGLDKKA